MKSTRRSPFKWRWSCLSPTLLTHRLHLEALYAAKVQQKQPRLSLSFVPCAALHDTINAHWVPLGAALMANAAPLCWLPQWFNSSWQQVTRSRPFLRKRCRLSQCQFENVAPHIAWGHAFIQRGKQFFGLCFPLVQLPPFTFVAGIPIAAWSTCYCSCSLIGWEWAWFRPSECDLWCKNSNNLDKTAHLLLSLWPPVRTVFFFILIFLSLFAINFF